MARNKELVGIFSEPISKRKPTKTKRAYKKNSVDTLINALQESKKKPRMEDTHVRSTFLLDRRLQARLDALASTQPRGFKTKFLNIAIESLLDQMEERNKG